MSVGIQAVDDVNGYGCKVRLDCDRCAPDYGICPEHVELAAVAVRLMQRAAVDKVGAYNAKITVCSPSGEQFTEFNPTDEVRAHQQRIEAEFQRRERQWAWFSKHGFDYVNWLSETGRLAERDAAAAIFGDEESA